MSEPAAPAAPDAIGRIAEAIKNANRKRPIAPGTSFYDAQERAYRVMAEAAMEEWRTICAEQQTTDLVERVCRALWYGAATNPLPGDLTEAQLKHLRVQAYRAIEQVRRYDEQMKSSGPGATLQPGDAAGDASMQREPTADVVSLHGGPTPEELARTLFQSWHANAKARNTLPKSVHGVTFDKLPPQERQFAFKQARDALTGMRTLDSDTAGFVAEHHDLRPAQVQAVWESVIDEILQRG